MFESFMSFTIRPVRNMCSALLVRMFENVCDKSDVKIDNV